METRRSNSGDLGVDLAGVEDGAEAVVAVGVVAGVAGVGAAGKKTKDEDSRSDQRSTRQFSSHEARTDRFHIFVPSSGCASGCSRKLELSISF